MDRNDTLRRIADLKARLQPILNAWHELRNGAKDDKGEERAFTAEELQKHNELATEIGAINRELEGEKAALKAIDIFNADDDKTAAHLGFSDRNRLPSATDEYRDAFHAAFRASFRDKGLNDATRQILGAEFQNLTGTSPSTGAVLIPTELERRIFAEAAAESPLLGVSNVVTINPRLNSLPFISDLGLLAPRAEGEEYVKTEPTLEAKSLDVKNFGGLGAFSNELLDDAPELEREFSRLASRAMAETVEEYGLKGVNGEADFTDLAGSPTTLTLTGKVPTGILNFATTTVPAPEAASLSALAYADIVDLMQAVHTSAKPRGEFLVSKDFETKAMKLVDDQNRPLWIPSVMAGQPSMIMGRPYHVSSRLDAFAASVTVALFGDFMRAHRIGLRRGVTIRTSEHFYFSTNLTAVAFDLRFASTVLYKLFIAQLVTPAT